VKQEPRGSYSVKKNRDEKSRETVTLSNACVSALNAQDAKELVAITSQYK
jgi:hypothetical protein